MVHNKNSTFTAKNYNSITHPPNSFKMLHKFLTITFFFVVSIASCSSSSKPQGMSLPLIPPLSPRSPFYTQILEANNISLSDTMEPMTLDRTHYLKWLLKSEDLNEYGEIHWPMRGKYRGHHVMDMYIGTKVQKVEGLFDTGSDVVWFQGGDRAGKTSLTFFNQTKSSTYRLVHCGDQSRCIHSNPNIVPCRDPQPCQFYTEYEDRTKTSGLMGTDDAHFKPEWDYIPNFTFGCSTENSDNMMGVIGASNSNYSLPRQIAPKDPKFSYCLSEDLTKTSLVSFGSQAKLVGQSLDTFTNRNNDFYYIEVVAIKVNGQDIDVNTSVFEMSQDGKQGFMIDSGTTVTELTQVAFDALKKKIEKVVRRPSTKYAFFQICYPSSTFGWWPKAKKPTIGIKFSNFVYQVPENRVWEKIPWSKMECLKILPTSSGLSILGYDMLLGANVGHDPNNMLLYLQQTTSKVVEATILS